MSIRPVRAKFKLDSFTSTLTSIPDGKGGYTQVELRTLVFSAVYSSDSNSENAKFFAFTPSAQISIGLTKPETWAQFELGQEYYADFTPAVAA